MRWFFTWVHIEVYHLRVIFWHLHHSLTTENATMRASHHLMESAAGWNFRNNAFILSVTDTQFMWPNCVWLSLSCKLILICIFKMLHLNWLYPSASHLFSSSQDGRRLVAAKSTEQWVWFWTSECCRVPTLNLKNDSAPSKPSKRHRYSVGVGWLGLFCARWKKTNWDSRLSVARRHRKGPTKRLNDSAHLF